MLLGARANEVAIFVLLKIKQCVIVMNGHETNNVVIRLITFSPCPNKMSCFYWR